MFSKNSIIFLIQLLVVIFSWGSANESCPEESLKLKCYDQEADDILFPNAAGSSHKINTAARYEVLKDSNCKSNFWTKFSFGDSGFGDLRNSSRGYGFFDKLSFFNKISKGWIQVEAHGDDKQLIKSFKCPVKVTAEDPVPKILGGSEKILEAEKDAECDGSQSVDNNNPLKKTQSLSFQWDCQLESEIGFATGFCRTGMTDPKYQGPVFKIPREFAENGAVFLITLKVRSTLDKTGTEIAVKQKITFLTNLSVLKIQCVTNCPNINPSKPVMFKVNCQKNCQDVSFKWSMKIGNRNRVIDGDKEMSLPENEMIRGNSYIIRVQTAGVDNPKGLAEMEFEIPKPPVLKHCRIDPQNGEAHLTQFRLYCDWYPRSSDTKLTTEIYSVNKGQKTLVTTLSEKSDIDLDTFVFTLPESTEAKVVIRDVHGGESSRQTSVNVEFQPKTTTPKTEDDEKERKINAIFDKAENETDPEKILQYIDELSKDFKDLPIDKALEHAIRALELLNKTAGKFTTEDQLIRATELTNDISGQFTDIPNPDLVSTATDLCRESAKLVLDRVTESERKENFRAKAEKNAEALINCSALALKNNSKIIEPKQGTDPYKQFNITTNVSSQFNMENVPQRTEYYPDYVDDENSTNALAKVRIFFVAVGNMGAKFYRFLI